MTPPTVEAARPCPACTSRSSRTLGDARGYAIQQCEPCGTWFTAQLPTPDAAMDYENWDYYEGGLDVPEFVLERLEQTVSTFGEYRSDRNAWLDIGSGAGTLLRAVSSLGWRGVGTEVSPAAARVGREIGLDVRVGEIDTLGLEPRAFDVVSLVEVVEHVHDPVGLLTRAAELVRPGGAVYVTTPHGRGISARLLGTRWSVVVPPEHLQLFSRAGLRTALNRAGLKVRSVRTHAVNPYELVNAVRRRPAATAPSRTETSYQLNETLSASRRGALVKAAANTLLSSSSLGDSVKVVAVRPG